MRIAVIQLRVIPGHRAAALQQALSAIDRAAETDPAPDLIVLPAFGDVPHLLAGKRLTGEHVEGPTVAASAYHARQWGVWIAFGMAERTAEKPFVTSVLLDVDGDVFCSRRQRKLSAAGRSRFASASVASPVVGDDVATVATPFGRIGLLVGEDVFDETAWRGLADNVDLVVSTACFAREARSPLADPNAAWQRLGELAASSKTCCAIADVTTAEGERPDCAGFSTILDAKGDRVAAAKTREAAVLFAQVPVESTRAVSGGRGGR